MDMSSQATACRYAGFYMSVIVSLAAMMGCGVGFVLLRDDRMMYLYVGVCALVLGAWLPHPCDLLPADLTATPYMYTSGLHSTTPLSRQKSGSAMGVDP